MSGIPVNINLGRYCTNTPVSAEMGYAILIQMYRLWYAVCRLQVRYGSRWGPRHPSLNLVTATEEILLSPGESITHLNAYSGSVIDGVQLNTTVMLYSWVGGNGGGVAFGRYGNKIVYLKGGVTNFYAHGTVVGHLNGVFDSCDF